MSELARFTWSPASPRSLMAFSNVPFMLMSCPGSMSFHCISSCFLMMLDSFLMASCIWSYTLRRFCMSDCFFCSSIISASAQSPSPCSRIFFCRSSKVSE